MPLRKNRVCDVIRGRNSGFSNSGFLRQGRNSVTFSLIKFTSYAPVTPELCPYGKIVSVTS